MTLPGSTEFSAKGDQARGRGVRDMPQANPSDPLAVLLCRDHDNMLSSVVSAFYVLSANKRFVDFRAAREPLAASTLR
jgi:hypothetical protein